MIKYLVLLLLLILTVVGDLKISKIRNLYVITAICAGLLVNLAHDGIWGMEQSVKGIFAPILLLGIFFVARQLGAGDIKLFSAIGSLFGWEFVIFTIFYTFILAGVLSLSGLLIESKIESTFKAFYRDLKLCLLANNLLFMESYGMRKTLRLSPSIAIAVIFQTLQTFLLHSH